MESATHGLDSMTKVAPESIAAPPDDQCHAATRKARLEESTAANAAVQVKEATDDAVEVEEESVEPLPQPGHGLPSGLFATGLTEGGKRRN